jgi:hypothetical protein
MALSRLAQQFADEIRNHDWSDAPYRIDRAGHQRSMDGPNNTTPQLIPQQTDNVRTNVMWVAAQVLGFNDPNFDVYEFAEACGVDTRTSSGRPKSGHITSGLRRRHLDGRWAVPGTYAYEEPNQAGTP